MSSTNTEIITVCKLKGKKIIDDTLDSVQDDDRNEENAGYSEDIESDDNVTDTILCILYKYGKLGAAYYNFTNRQLHVYEEILESAPQYLSTVSLFREINPKYVLTVGNKSEIFVKILSEIFMYGESSLNTTATNDTIQIPKNLFLVPSKDFTYEICKAIISQLKLAVLEDEPSETKREVYIHSLINFDNRLSMQAIGTLVKFLEKNCTFFGVTEKDELSYIHINQVSRKNHLLLDNSTLRALQIFSKRGHESGFKRGLHSSEREGLSIFKLFCMNCKSKIGLLTLKNVLLNPINDIDVLNNRLDFIEFVQDPTNRDFIETLRQHIKLISGNINEILSKIENSRAKVRDWQNLYKTIYHTIVLKNVSLYYKDKSALLMDLHEKVSNNLIGLEESIQNGLDFDASCKRGKPVIRFGLDDSLDKKKLRKQDILNDVIAASRFAAEKLPEVFDECSVIYLPEMGHLLALKESTANFVPEEWKDYQWFKLGGRIHYKNPMCVELDRRLGDTIAEIIDHENRILRRLSGFIIKYNKDIREPLKIIGMIDCLISMAITASTKMYTRPILNKNNFFELKSCKHPLMEETMDQFQSNDFFSGGQYSRMKIITGPNGSGKSVYLKQISLAIYMAHIGSFVPCVSANVHLLDTMHTRLVATESVAVRLSSFMIDLTQMAHALTNNNDSSLVCLDEFGKGTTEIEGVCLLEGALRHFLDKGIDGPHVLVATHFQKIRRCLPDSPLIQYQKMEHTKQDGVLYFLYKITEGVSNSFAIDVAEAIGIDKDIIERARYIYNCIVNEESVAPFDNVLRRNNFDPYNYELLNIPEPDELHINDNVDLVEEVSVTQDNNSKENINDGDTLLEPNDSSQIFT